MKYLSSNELKEFAKKFFENNKEMIEYRPSCAPVLAALGVKELYLNDRCIGLQARDNILGITLYPNVLYGDDFYDKTSPNYEYRMCKIDVMRDGEITCNVISHYFKEFKFSNTRFKVLNSTGESVFNGTYDQCVEYGNTKEESYDITVMV